MGPDPKRSLRRELRARRAALTQAERAAAHAAMAARLMALAAERDASTIGVYAAHRSEADPAGAVARWLESGVVVAWPRVEADDSLHFHALDGPEGLVKGYRGVMEPPLDAPPVALEALDLLVVPGVGFDAGGHRLGQGGGHFDRMLARPELRAFTAGLAYHVQVVDAVPREPHDQRLDAVVTERGVARGGGWTLGPMA